MHQQVLIRSLHYLYIAKCTVILSVLQTVVKCWDENSNSREKINKEESLLAFSPSGHITEKHNDAC